VIAFVTGRLAEKGPDHAVIEVGGIGLRMAMSTNSIVALPAPGDEVTVHTHLHVREDEISLFGFESVRERQLFGTLITVSGIGPKVALAALSSFSPDELTAAITSGDDALVSSIPGVGKKTAQRIILELGDKLGDAVERGAGEGAAAATANATSEARDGLAAMGFSAAEISAALKGYDGGADDASAMLRYALKRLGGGA